MNPPGEIYFIGPEDDGPIKVGFTRKGCLKQRIRDLQCGCWLPLRCYGTVRARFKDEFQLHAQLSMQGFHIRGEWFEREPALELLKRISERNEGPPR